MGDQKLKRQFLSSCYGLVYNNENVTIKENPTGEEVLLMTGEKRILEKVAQQITSTYVAIKSFDILKPSSSKYICNKENEVNVAEKDIVQKLGRDTVRKVLFPTNQTTNKSKKDRCFYCGKENAKISRHLQTVHKNEKEVKMLLEFPKGADERNKILDTLRKKGNFNYNSQNNSNNIYLVRKPRKKHIDQENYKPCPSCKGYYSVKSLRKHFIRCGDHEKGRRNILKQSRALERKIHPKASAVLREVVFPVLREDAVCRVIRYDELIIIFGNRLCQKFKSFHHHDMIRARLRLLGRFMLALRENGNQIEKLEDALKPSIFDEVIKAVNQVAKLDERRGKYKSPATAFYVGNLLKECTKLYRIECIKRQQHEEKKIAGDFLKLLESELNVNINKTVAENWNENKRQKKVLLPTIEDIKALTSYLNNRRHRYLEELEKDGFSPHNWKNLMKATLVSILIFNRRRPGELERCTIEDYKSYISIDQLDDTDEIFKSLTEDAKRRAKEFVRFEIRGKKGRTVPVLLDRFMKNCIDKLLEFREEAGVCDENQFLFAKNNVGNDKQYYRAYWLLKDFTKKCGAKFPERLKATELRKHVATTSARLNLSESDIANLQEFMGHADKIHREIYRQPLQERDILNMSKLLTIAQGHSDNENINREENNCQDLPDGRNHEDNNEIHNDGIDSDLDSNEEMKRPEKRKDLPTSKKAVIEANFHEASEELSIEENNCYNLPDGNSTEIHDTDIRTSDQDIDENFEQKSASRKIWTTPEKNVVKTLFHKNIKQRILPSINSLTRALAKNSVLKHRSITTLKAYVVNLINKEKRQPQRRQAPRRYWTTPEKRAMKLAFADQLANRQYPSNEEFRQAATSYAELASRTPKKMRSFIQHAFRRKINFK